MKAFTYRIVVQQLLIRGESWDPQVGGRDDEFAAVLTDYDLPGQNGVWLLVQLATRPGLRKVLTSGRDIPGIEALNSAGVVDRFVKKPATPEELFQALEG